MTVKYCLPIIANTKEEVLQILKTKGYNYYEIWLDYLKNLDENLLLRVAEKYREKIIFVLRRKNLEKIRLNPEKRKEIISLLAHFNVTLDIDFLTQHEELEFFCKISSKNKLIISFHNYKETPKIDYLQNMISKMKRYNADIYKISTFCQKDEDAISLLDLLLQLKQQNLKYIILGMGKHGLATRIFGALWGNEMIFAPKNKLQASAPGQLTREKLETIFSIFSILEE